MRELLKMSDEAIMRVLSSKEFHRDLAQKYVDGAKFMDADCNQYGGPYFVGPREDYNEMPKTIKITFEVSRPASVSDEVAYSYFFFYINGKSINFSSEQAYDAFSASLLKAIEEAMHK